MIKHQHSVMFRFFVPKNYCFSSSREEVWVRQITQSRQPSAVFSHGKNHWVEVVVGDGASPWSPSGISQWTNPRWLEDPGKSMIFLGDVPANQVFHDDGGSFRWHGCAPTIVKHVIFGGLSHDLCPIISHYYPIKLYPMIVIVTTGNLSHIIFHIRSPAFKKRSKRIPFWKLLLILWLLLLLLWLLLLLLLLLIT